MKLLRTEPEALSAGLHAQVDTLLRALEQLSLLSSVSAVFAVLYRCSRGPTRRKARSNGIFSLSRPLINGRKRNRNGAKTAPSTAAVDTTKIGDEIIEHQQTPGTRDQTTGSLRSRSLRTYYGQWPRAKAAKTPVSMALHCPLGERLSAAPSAAQTVEVKSPIKHTTVRRLFSTSTKRK